MLQCCYVELLLRCLGSLCHAPTVMLFDFIWTKVNHNSYDQYKDNTKHCFLLLLLVSNWVLMCNFVFTCFSNRKITHPYAFLPQVKGKGCLNEHRLITSHPLRHSVSGLHGNTKVSGFCKAERWKILSPYVLLGLCNVGV